MTVIAIDGPSGAGKSTLAAALAKRLGLRHVDTGAYYRAAALAVLRAGLAPDDAERSRDVVALIHVERRAGRTLLDGEDVEEILRGPEVTQAVSAVARQPRIRELLVQLQRAEVDAAGAVVEGRDAGTVVVPDAALKVWLTATPDERAQRRAAQTGADGAAALEAQSRALSQRDASDAAQMARAADAIEIDTTGRSVAALVDELIERLEAAMAERME